MAWAIPADLNSLDGLGGGLSWAEDESLCAALQARFDAETFDYFGARLFTFVTCEELTDALLRGFAMWSANHGRLAFFSVSHECAVTGQPAAACNLTEIVVTSGTTPAGTALAVEFERGGANSTFRRATLTLDTSPSTCYYMDGTVCEALRDLGVAARLPQFLRELLSMSDLALAYVIARFCIYLPALVGLLYFVHNVMLLMHRSHRAGCAQCLYVVASLSHRWRLVTLLFVLPPLIDWKMVMPCERCLAFEALATHAAGRVLGLEATPTSSSPPPSTSPLPPALPPSRPPPPASPPPVSTCPAAMWRNGSGLPPRYTALDPPAPMAGSTCLAAPDVAALAALYPDCVAAGAVGAPMCLGAKRNIWAFRLCLTVTPVLSLFVALMLPAIFLVRKANRRRVRSLAALLTRTIAAEEARAAAQKRSHFADREAVPQSDRHHRPALRADAVGAHAHDGDHREAHSLEGLAARLRADLQSAKAASKAAAKAHRAAWGHNGRRGGSQAQAREAERPQASLWLARPGEGLAAARPAASDAGADAQDGHGAAASASPTAVMAAILRPAAAKLWEGACLDAAGERRRARLDLAAAHYHAVARAQRIARALRHLSSDVHDGAAAWADDEETRATELLVLAESTFWHELGHAIPALIDLIAKADRPMRLRIGRALRATCKHYVAAAQRPDRSPLVADHGHPRLLGLRYAPLVREVHRPLLLRFLVEQGAELDELRQRKEMRIVRLAPPSFMGPPTGPPTGDAIPAPLSLPAPSQLIAAIDAGNGTVGFARPHSMRPPRGVPLGERTHTAPRRPPQPREATSLVTREMLAPQKLASMSQLLRRVATATAENAQLEVGAQRRVADLGGAARRALRTF